MRLAKIFTEHPASVGENYLQHLAMASSFGLRLLAAGLACLLHGLFPFAFVKTGSLAISQLHNDMVTHRVRRPLPDATGGDVKLT